MKSLHSACMSAGLRRARACKAAPVGASVGHVQVHGACAVGIGQDLLQGGHQLLGAGVGHALAPVGDPPCAAASAPACLRRWGHCDTVCNTTSQCTARVTLASDLEPPRGMDTDACVLTAEAYPHPGLPVAVLWAFLPRLAVQHLNNQDLQVPPHGRMHCILPL